MLNRRWWDVAVAAGSIVIAVALLLGFRPGDAHAPVRIAVGLATIALFALGYVLVARPAIGARTDWRFLVFVVLAALAVGVGAGAAGFLAMLQTLAYPLAWVLGDTRRRGIVASGAIALGVGIGITVGGGLTGGAWVAGAVTAGFSFVFAVALGLWIVSIAEYGEERGRLLAELTAAQTEVEALSRDRGAAQERARLSRDIHDTLAQTLAGLVLLAERAGRQSRTGEGDAATTTIATVERVARDALDEARALVARTAAVPAEPAFESAAERLVERFRTQGTAVIDLEFTGAATLARDTQVILLRCLQEALANTAKHADAHRVIVRIVVDDEDVVLAVADDGRGFDTAAPRAGFGLDGMTERVALAGGELQVSSSAGTGTTLRVRLRRQTAGAQHRAGHGARREAS